MNLFQRVFRGSIPRKVALKSPSATIEYYRRWGFFSQQSTEQILAQFREDWGTKPQAGKPWDDAFLLRYDEVKVWTGDPEADVCSENQVYVSTLLEWAKITENSFTLTDIQEKWHSDNGPIEVTFLTDKRSVTLKPKFQDDWIDLEILIELNRILQPTGKRFNCAVDGNFCLVVFLADEIERHLRQERSFPFALP